MRARKPVPAEIPPSYLLDAIEAWNTVSSTSKPILQTTLRIPTAVADEAAGLARAHAVSMNVFVLDAIDRRLREHGRPSIAELAPWAFAHFRRER